MDAQRRSGPGGMVENSNHAGGLEKIVSGGQTGVDRAALDAALARGLPAGGWCPAGRKAEDGRIPERYDLTELPTGGYRKRTEWNVRDSDATLILARGVLGGGTLLTVNLARKHNRHLYVLDLNADPDPETVAHWLRRHRIRVLNIAGPRESGAPGIHDQAVAFLEMLLARL